MKRLLSILPFLLIIGLLLASCAESGLSPSSDFYVYDEAGVLTGETHDYIVEQNRRLESLTGAQIVVMTVRTTGDEEMDDFATRVFNAWGIGDEEEDNGVLLLLSIEEDDYWVLQGQGLEDILSSGILKLMLNEHMEPHFAIKDYDAGVRETFDALLDHLESAYSITIAEGSEDIIGETETEIEPTIPHEIIPASGIYKMVKRLIRFCSRLLVLALAVSPFLVIVAIIVVVLILAGSGRGRRTPPPPGANRNPYSSRTRVHYTPGRGPSGFTPPPPPPPGGFGTHRSTTFGGSRPAGNSKTYRPTGGFGGPRPTGGFGGTRPSGFGGSRPSGGFGGSRPSGGFHGGGGHSRGGGAGRR